MADMQNTQAATQPSTPSIVRQAPQVANPPPVGAAKKTRSLIDTGRLEGVKKQLFPAIGATVPSGHRNAAAFTFAMTNSDPSNTAATSSVGDQVSGIVNGLRVLTFR